MSNSKNHTPSKCLCTILHHLICSNNLSSPLHPLTQLHTNPHHHHHQHQHHDHHHTSAIVDQPQTSEEPRKNPGIVARLMGLDSLPNPHPHQNYNYESFYRSKSLNSLKFLPNFDPARVSFHRRAATSASFREREIGDGFFARNEENPDLIARKQREVVNIVKQDGKQRREKMVMLKEDVRIRGSRERSGCKSKGNGGKYYYQRRRTNNCARNKIEKSAEILQSDVPSRSPVSVLDHPHHRRRPTHGFDSPSKGNSNLVSSSPRRKSSGNKLKILDEKAPQGVVAKLKFQKKNRGHGWNYGRWEEDSNCMKTEMEMVGYFGVISRQVSKLVEEEISDPKRWNIKYQMLKIGFIQHFCQHFGLQLLDFLLDELMHELIVN